MDKQAIERRHTIVAKIGADTRERLADELRFLADQIDRDSLTVGCSGSPSGGAIYSYKADGLEHDAYFEAINRALQSQTEGDET